MTKAPKELVTNGIANYGSYHEFIKNINLLDRKTEHFIPRVLKNFRLKEWEAIQLFNDDFFIISALLNAKSLGIMQTIMIDRKTNSKHVIHKKTYHRFIKVGQGLYDSQTSFNNGENSVCFHNDAKQKVFSIDIDHQAKGISCHGTGMLRGLPLSIYYPFENDNSLYTCKMAMPFYGNVSIGNDVINADNSVLIIDDHKGFYPYHMKYQWATSATTVNGNVIAFNFTSNDLKDVDIHNENVVWYGKDIHHFGSVSITPKGDHWTVCDKEHRINLTFTPEYQYDFEKSVGPIKADYHSPIGYFNGMVKLSNNEILEVVNWYGMAEDINHSL